MVKSKDMYSPQNYLSAITGKCFINRGTIPIDFIRTILEEEGYGDTLWDYPLTEIDHIVENKLNVVLVDCSYYNGDEYFTEYRWFEVTEDFQEEI